METIKSLYDLLSWLIYSGGAILLGSWILDRIPAFVALTSDWKKYINMAVSAALALAAYALITYVPASVFDALAPWFSVVAGIVVLYGVQQINHQLTK